MIRHWFIVFSPPTTPTPSKTKWPHNAWALALHRGWRFFLFHRDVTVRVTPSCLVLDVIISVNQSINQSINQLINQEPAFGPGRLPLLTQIFNIQQLHVMHPLAWRTVPLMMPRSPPRPIPSMGSQIRADWMVTRLGSQMDLYRKLRDVFVPETFSLELFCFYLMPCTLPKFCTAMLPIAKQ